MGLDDRQAEKHLTEITGRSVEGTAEIVIDEFTNSACLGEAVSIVYKANKKHLGDIEDEYYEHKFNKGTLLISNGKQLLIYGRDMKINYRGVIN
jgi:hypothetical protein